jgi:hypothetical protein
MSMEEQRDEKYKGHTANCSVSNASRVSMTASRVKPCVARILLGLGCLCLHKGVSTWGIAIET